MGQGLGRAVTKPKDFPVPLDEMRKGLLTSARTGARPDSSWLPKPPPPSTTSVSVQAYIKLKSRDDAALKQLRDGQRDIRTDIDELAQMTTGPPPFPKCNRPAPTAAYLSEFHMAAMAAMAAGTGREFCRRLIEKVSRL